MDSTLKVSLPPVASRCTEVLTDVLRGHQGIHRVEFDINSGQLKVEYDPRLLVPERALYLVRQSAQVATQRVMQCAVKQEFGLEACAHCTLEMRDVLLRHYRAGAELPQAIFQDGVMLASLGAGNETAIVEEKVIPLPEKAAARPFLTAEKVELLFTILTAVFG